MDRELAITAHSQFPQKRVSSSNSGTLAGYEISMMDLGRLQRSCVRPVAAALSVDIGAAEKLKYAERRKPERLVAEGCCKVALDPLLLGAGA